MSNRMVDGYNKIDGIIYESKYGRASLSEFIKTEIKRDSYLLESGAVNSVEWHFFVSETTGKGGPTKHLLEALLEACKLSAALGGNPNVTKEVDYSESYQIWHFHEIYLKD